MNDFTTRMLYKISWILSFFPFAGAIIWISHFCLVYNHLGRQPKVYKDALAGKGVLIFDIYHWIIGIYMHIFIISWPLWIFVAFLSVKNHSKNSILLQVTIYSLGIVAMWLFCVKGPSGYMEWFFD